MAERIDKALYRVAREANVDEQRLRRWVSFLALCGVLQRAIDEGAIAYYQLKGGAALELRYADRARTTKDIDVGLAGNRDERLRALERAVALGFDEFTFRVRDPYDMERADTLRVDVAIAYRSHGFQTIQVDLGPAGEAQVDLIAPAIRGIAELGLPITSPIRCITIPLQIAQKLHACADARMLGEDNRARDIMDIVLLGLLDQIDHQTVHNACAEFFTQRGLHKWPPIIDLPHEWIAELDRLAAEHDFPFRTGGEIVAAFNDIYARIAACNLVAIQ